MSLHLTPLTSDIEPQFWATVERDACDYYFFIYDLLLLKSKTEIFLAKKGDVVEGLIVIYDGTIAQLRGNRDAVAFMLKALSPKQRDVQVPLDCRDLVTARFPSAGMVADITLMRLDKGNEKLIVSTAPEPLTASDAGDIADLMHRCYPEMWSDIQKEAVEGLFNIKEALWVGVREGGVLASFGYAMRTPNVSHVTWICTRPEHERRGYATSIVSCLVKACLEVSDTAIIYVMNDNAVAGHVYSRVGFVSYKQYAFVRT